MDSSGLYRAITDSARSAPGWAQSAFEVWTEYGLLLFGLLFIAVWWRARGQAGPRAVALAVAAPLATALAYVASELVKSAVDEERPCRAVAGAAAPLLACPAPGDWSFPSNHSAIAGAAAVALALAVRRLALAAVPLAVLMAFSRVFVGVHYPHDVLAGLLLGGALAALAVPALTGPISTMTAAMRASGGRAAVWFTGPGPARRP
ncbi:phosphatase PAP2 family protein [Streptomyces vinaceus]|uniref:Phosphatase PAP2 family protein n=1 Tax=Streptomyces vinaceus TaxID=1960 RepID=A0A5J6JC10_STRVI|nr:phosphatase PAP2 family protein [Streptomyces vinaceus]QEV46264.1 phosphatase PAP2 family protein [Streptomyces vinaceus]GHE65280.1 phosphatase PAP2 family protein [Streptomyces vinaceus]